MPFQPRNNAALLFLALSAFGSCTSPSRVPDTTPLPSELLREPLAAYRGEACARVLHSIPDEDEEPLDQATAKEPQAPELQKLPVDRSLEAQLLLAVCARREARSDEELAQTRWPRMAELPLKETYLAFDDRRSPRLPLAIAIVQAAARLSAASLLGEARQELGLVLFLAAVLEPAALAAELAQVPVPSEAKQAFLSAYARIPARLPDSLLAQEEARLLIDVPRTVWEKRRAHFLAFASYYAQLDVLAARAKAARHLPAAIEPTVQALLDLRASFVQACGSLRCTTLPLFGLATSELAQLHVLRQNVLAARCESLVHLEEGSWLSGLAQAVFAEQLAYGTFLREAHTRYRQAREHGSDGPTALALAGGTSGFPFEDTQLLPPKLALPNYAAALTQEREQHSAAAHVVTCQGERCQVTFQAERTEATDEYDCNKTSRIVRILKDGTLQYEEACKSRPITLEQRRPAVFFPAREVRSLQRGDLLSFVTAGDEGCILRVGRNRQLVQLRDTRGQP